VPIGRTLFQFPSPSKEGQFAALPRATSGQDFRIAQLLLDHYTVPSQNYPCNGSPSTPRTSSSYARGGTCVLAGASWLL